MWNKPKALPLFDCKVKCSSLIRKSALFFTNAGHIIGASIELTIENKVLVFSVMLVDNDALMYPPTKPQKADYVFLESTY
jgi:metallo-beta-lactamase family protein